MFRLSRRSPEPETSIISDGRRPILQQLDVVGKRAAVV